MTAIINSYDNYMITYNSIRHLYIILSYLLYKFHQLSNIRDIILHIQIGFDIVC